MTCRRSIHALVPLFAIVLAIAFPLPARAKGRPNIILISRTTRAIKTSAVSGRRGSRHPTWTRWRPKAFG